MKLSETNIKRALKNVFLRRKESLVLLEPRPGLGDSIICVGLVKTLALLYPNTFFYYACTGINSFHTISWLLMDLPNVFPVQTFGGKEARQLSGFWNSQHWEIGVDNLDYNKFDQCYYDQYKIPFINRWEYGTLLPGPKAYDLSKKFVHGNEEYILVCDTQSSNQCYQLKIDNPNNLKIIKVSPVTQNICDWLLLAENAIEIHTIDTSFIHLIESYFYKLNKHPQLFFHMARNAGTKFTTLLPWTIVNYYVT